MNRERRGYIDWHGDYIDACAIRVIDPSRNTRSVTESQRQRFPPVRARRSFEPHVQRIGVLASAMQRQSLVRVKAGDDVPVRDEEVPSARAGNKETGRGAQAFAILPDLEQ